MSFAALGGVIAPVFWGGVNFVVSHFCDNMNVQRIPHLLTHISTFNGGPEVLPMGEISHLYLSTSLSLMFP